VAEKQTLIDKESRRATSFAILSVAVQLYESFHLKMLCLKVTQGHQNCRCLLRHISSYYWFILVTLASLSCTVSKILLHLLC